MRLLATAALAALTFPAASAQGSNCDTFLGSQAEVDAFDCTSIPYLTIQGADITNLNGLSELVSVDGELGIFTNDVLTDVSGLAGLTSAGELSFVTNPVLTNLDGLTSLTSVGTLYLLSNPALANVDGLAALASVGDELYIGGNDALANVNGLAALTSVGGDAEVGYNAVLTNVDGLAALASVGGNFYVQSNPALANVNGLAALTSVGGDFRVGVNDVLADVDGLTALASTGGYLRIDSNPALANVDGLAGLTSVGGYLYLYLNPALTNVDGLAALTSVGGYLVINANAALADVDGLAALTSIGGYLGIVANPALTNVDGLAALAFVGGSDGFGLYVKNNGGLARCAVGFGPILTAEAADDFTVQDGFGGANEYSEFSGNDPAGDCNGEATILAAYVPAEPPVALPIADVSLTAPGGELVLPAGRARVAVTAEATFTADQGQRFTVFVRLDGPDGFSRLAFRGEVKPEAGETVSQEIRFRTFASDPAGAYTVTLLVAEGSVEAPETAEPIATLPATKLGGAGLRVAEALSAYPNPAAGQATLRFGVAEAGEATLVVYDALGREVARPVDGAVEGVVEARVDASGLAPGVYVARLVTAAGTETVRLTVAR